MARYIKELPQEVIDIIDDNAKSLTDQKKMWVVKYRGHTLPLGKVRMFKHRAVAFNKLRDYMDSWIWSANYTKKGSFYKFIQEHKNSPVFLDNPSLFANEIIELLIEKGIIEIIQG